MNTILQKLKVKIFSDGADRQSMLEMAANPIISGITTNPSLMRKAGVTQYREYCVSILKEITSKDISFEVFADDISEMKRQALEIKSWGKNVYVKIPVTNTKGESTASLIKELTNAGIKLNVTAVFTVEQVKTVCAALKNGAPSYVSVFAGRIADAGVDPMPLMKDALKVCRDTSSEIELLWASTREPFNIIQADQVGCDIITVPPEIIKKLNVFGKSLDQFSLETVKMFKNDSDASGFSL